MRKPLTSPTTNAMRIKLFGDLRTLSLVLASSIALTGCMGSKELKPADGQSSVRIPVESQGQFKMESVVLEGVKDYTTLEGSAARFVLYPRMGESTISGARPNFKFSKGSKSQFQAMDDLSLQAAMIAYHFQEFKKMDAQLGLDGVLKYPRAVGLAIDKSLKIVNNAFYDSKTDAFVFVPFTDSSLPLMANAGVLAHEHFHSLFNKLIGAEIRSTYTAAQIATDHIHDGVFIGQPPEREQKVAVAELSVAQRELYHQVVFRGINEGLADVWAWIYTGNPDFLALSLPREKEGRTLEKPKNLELVFDSVEKIKLDILDTEADEPSPRAKYLNFVSYGLGTQLSRHLKVAASQLKVEKEISETESRRLLAKALLAALPELKGQFLSLKENEYLAPNAVYDIIKRKLSEL